MEQRFPKLTTPKELMSSAFTMAPAGPTAGSPSRVLTTLAAYVPAHYDGVNRSGVLPMGHRVLVLPDVAEELSAGGVYIPPEVQSRNAMGAETGVLVAVGEGAFVWSSDRIHPWTGRKPMPGNRVIIERYSGQVQRGLDGQIYRICDDKAIGALFVVDAQNAVDGEQSQ